MLIGAVTLALLWSWFRYTCRTVLRVTPGREVAADFVERHRLRYPEAKKDVRNTSEESLQVLVDAVARDWRRLRGVLAKADSPLESLVRADYFYQRAVFTLTAPWWPTAARRSVREMAEVVEYLARTASMRERVRTAPPGPLAEASAAPVE